VAATLTRNTLGRLAAFAATPVTDVSEAFDTADWAGTTGATLSLSSGRLRVSHAAAAASRQVNLTALAAQDDVFVQGIWFSRSGGGGSGGIVARSQSAAIPDNGIVMLAPNGFSGDRALREREAGATTQQDATASVNDSLPTRHSLWVRDDIASAFAHGPATAYALAGLGIPTPGLIGVFHSSGSAATFDFSEFYAMTDAVLRVSGPEWFRWRAVLVSAGGTELATATSVAGLAEVDCFAARVLFPTAVKLEIRRLDDDTLLIDDTPDETLWGGDVWEITGIDPPTSTFEVEVSLAVLVDPAAVMFEVDVTVSALSTGFVERATPRPGDPRLWRRRISLVDPTAFTVAPLATLAEELFVTLDGEFLETL
jgi:hypothetical protein